jgi:hypothetical protein
MHILSEPAYVWRVKDLRSADRLQKVQGLEKCPRRILVGRVEVIETTRHKIHSYGINRAPFRRTSHVDV